MPKNIENCKRIQIKKRFHIFVSARLWKCTADLSFDCWFYPTEMFLTQHGSTLLNWCLKTLKTVKKIQTKKRSHIFVSACLRNHTADLSLDCRLFYPTEIGFNPTWLNITELMPKNIENCRRIQIKKRFHIFVSACLRKHTTNFSFDCRLFHPIEMVLTQHGPTLLNWCLKTLKNVKEFK